MKFKVIWIESHNPYNWGDTYKKGKQNILNSFPNPHIIDLGNNDEWVDIECWDNFEADNIEKAYKYVIDNYEIPNDVFSIHDENGNCVATEEGVEIPKRKGDLK